MTPHLPGEQSERVDLAVRLRARADYVPSRFDANPLLPLTTADRGLLRQAASLIDQQARQLEAADHFADRYDHAVRVDADDSDMRAAHRARDAYGLTRALDPERNTDG